MTDKDSALRLPRQGTKQAALFGLLSRDNGATISEIVTTTGWRPNTIHAALTTLRTSGWHISADKTGSERRYRLVNSTQRQT